MAGLTRLTDLQLGKNSISDISPLAELTQLTSLSLGGNSISDISVLAGLTQLESLGLSNNDISDVSPLLALNLRWTTSDSPSSTGLYLEDNPLSYVSINTHIPALQAKGIEVKFDNVAHPALVKISGDGQDGLPGRP